MKTILSVESVPNGDGESYHWYVGWKFADKEITHILQHDENLGTYAIRWFVAYHYNEVLLKINALHTVAVLYKEIENGTVFPPVPPVPATDAGDGSPVNDGDADR